MKKPSAAAAKRVNQANLEALGADRLAALLLELGDSQPSLKRRLRMELAAEVGAEALAIEIDKRLATIAASGARVSWRKRPEFITDLQVQRTMIADRLGALDADVALPRMWDFLALSPRITARVKDPKEELPPVFAAAAADLGRLAAQSSIAADDLAEQFADAIANNVTLWGRLLEHAVEPLGRQVGVQLLALVQQAPPKRLASPSFTHIVQVLADAAGDADAYLATIPDSARTDPGVGAGIARRLLAAGRAKEALAALEASNPKQARSGLGWKPKVAVAPLAAEAWEAVHILALEQSGDVEAAQTARWIAFEATLSADRLRDYIKRLADFEDVVAADKAFDHAARHADFMTGLRFLIDWPALPEAARMILARQDEIVASDPSLEEWSARLHARQPLAALVLLRAVILDAVRQRNHAVADALLPEAQALAENALGDVEPHEAFLERMQASRRR